MNKTALIAGQGGLPGALIRALEERGDPFMVAGLHGFETDLPGTDVQSFHLERLVPFMDHLLAEGVGKVCFAGAVRRPKLEPELFDARTAAILPGLLAAFHRGDDAALRAVVALFEDWSFEVVGAHEIAPEMVPGPGVLAGQPTDQDGSDAARGAEILIAIAPLDIGQGVVVANGLCLALETLPGTDAMLDFVERCAQRVEQGRDRMRGVFYKAPKAGQDRRVDLPTLGPETVRAAVRAGLAGIAWEAGGVLLLDRAAMVALARDHGLFLWSRAP